MNWLEKHFRKYAISNLSLIIIICYGFGYVLQAVNSAFLGYLTLNPYAIVHGQIWRLVTWVLVPPDSSNFIFVIIAMMFYYSIGTALERVWGTWEYNVYIFSGLLFTIAGAFVNMGITYLVYPGLIGNSAAASAAFAQMAFYFSTYYVCMSIFLAYAATFPDATVLFMFIIPVKVKWLGIIYGVILAYDFIMNAAGGAYYACIAILSSLAGFLIFWLRTRHSQISRFRPREMKRRADFRRSVSGANSWSTRHARSSRPSSDAAGDAPQMQPRRGTAHHRCAICGRTELDDPTLEFRFCSKCEGTFEFCQDHLFNHIHAAGGQGPKPM